MRDIIMVCAAVLVGLCFLPTAWKLLELRLQDATQEAPRLCDLGGVRCKFLRFYDEDQVLFRINAFVRPGERDALYKRFKETGIVPHGCSIETARKTWALVELPTGDVFKAAPDLIKFINPESVKDGVV